MQETTGILPVLSIIPFGIMLLMIAIGPLVAEHWWEKNRNKLLVSLILGVPTAIYLVFKGLGHDLEHQLVFDYLPFIILLGALFVITGGIHLSGDIESKPIINTLFLFIGYILASLMGTTGAAMLLIRPLISTNSQRKYKVHTILFFIATVANCGGLLTPLGDPPLFLLYLRGTEFTWFFKLLPEWLLVGGLLLLIYFLTDLYFYSKESKDAIKNDRENVKPLRLRGKWNFVLLLGVVLSVALVNENYIPSMKSDSYFMKFLREIILLVLIGISLLITKKKVRDDNKFTWTPITEVAYLFLGIFITMTPALIYLKAHAADFGLSTPGHFFYATGALSSFLDNAPTALAFHGVAAGLPQTEPIVAGISEILLEAISLGAVFFGAMTYIANGPNFMVKAIAEENGIKMPSFFSYIYKFSIVILLPIFMLVKYLLL